MIKKKLDELREQLFVRGGHAGMGAPVADKLLAVLDAMSGAIINPQHTDGSEPIVPASATDARPVRKDLFSVRMKEGCEHCGNESPKILAVSEGVPVCPSCATPWKFTGIIAPAPPAAQEQETVGTVAVHPASTEVSAARDRLLAFVREVRPGGCRKMSSGRECQCPLCDIDRLFSREADLQRFDREIDEICAEPMSPDEIDVIVGRVVAVDEVKRLKSDLAASQSRVEELEAKSITCCFCNEPCESLASLKEHSATCGEHPAVKEVERLVEQNIRFIDQRESAKLVERNAIEQYRRVVQERDASDAEIERLKSKQSSDEAVAVRDSHIDALESDLAAAREENVRLREDVLKFAEDIENPRLWQGGSTYVRAVIAEQLRGRIPPLPSEPQETVQPSENTVEPTLQIPANKVNQS